MYTQLKWRSVTPFVLAILGAIVVSRLLSINWLQWQVSIEDRGNGYDIEMFDDRLNTSDRLENINFPSQIAKIYSSNGECWWGDIKLETSADDRLKEKWLLRLFNGGLVVSWIVVALSFINLVRHWWKKYLTKISLLLSISAVLFLLSRFLGPKASIDPDFSKMDFQCRFDLIINANLALINPQAVAYLTIGSLLALVATILLIRTWSYSTSTP